MASLTLCDHDIVVSFLSPLDRFTSAYIDIKNMHIRGGNKA